MPNVLYFRVDFTVNLESLAGYKSNGSSSIFLKINQPPTNGSCFIDLASGYAMLTYFSIECVDWVDVDGFITRYEYFGKDFDSTFKMPIEYCENNFYN